MGSGRWAEQLVHDDEAAQHYKIGLRLQSGGRVAAALTHFQRARVGFELSENQEGMAASLQAEARALRLLGRHDESIAAYTSAKRIFDNTHRLLDQARCALGLGHGLAGVGRFQEALDAYVEARTLYQQTGRQQDIAGATMSVGQALSLLHRYDEALETLELAVTKFRDLQDDQHVAACHLSIGNIQRNLNQLDTALDSYAYARTIYSRTGNQLSVARCIDATAQTLHMLSRFDEAMAAFEDSEALYEVHSPSRRPPASCSIGIGHALRYMGRLSEAIEKYSKAEELCAETGHLRRMAMAKLGAVQAYSQMGEFAAAQRLLAEAANIFAEFGDQVSAARCHVMDGTILARTNRRSQALNAFHDASRIFEGAQHFEDLAFCSIWVAQTLLDDGRAQDAVDHVLAALPRIGESRYALRYPADRRRVLESWKHAYQLALRVAAAIDDPALIAELVELIRTQSVPNDVATSTETNGLGLESAFDVILSEVEPQPDSDILEPSASSDDHLDQQLAIARTAAGVLPLAPPLRVAIRGVSRIASTPDVRSTPVDVDEVRRRIDPSAWWFGTWIHGKELWWSLIMPDRQPQGGSLPIRKDVLDQLPRAVARVTPADSAVAEREALPAPSRQACAQLFAEARCLNGPLVANREAGRRARSKLALFSDKAASMLPTTSDPLQEQRRLAMQLGEALLPAALTDELVSRLDGDPLPLLIAPAPELASIPWSFLALRGAPPTQAGDVRRLIEAAIPALVPAAGFIGSEGSSEPPGEEAVVIVVCNPTGGLRFANWIPPDATHVLASAAHGPAGYERLDPTPDNLLRLLSNVRPGHRGAFVYQGHHQTAAVDDVVHMSGLRLINRDGSDGLVAPHAFLHHPSPTRPNCPETAWLFGCDTLAGNAAPEWLTITPALVWAGARSVVSTIWPTLDSEATRAFEHSLLRSAMEAPDVRVVLRELQLRTLLEFRASPSESNAPYLWAAYTVTVS